MNTSARKIISLSKAAASFRELVDQEALCAKAAALQSASTALARLLSGESPEDGADAADAAVHDIQDAFKALMDGYEPPSRSEWRNYIAWSNLKTLYGALEL